jgi:hypothetical protein
VAAEVKPAADADATSQDVVMKKRYLAIGLLAASMTTFGQRNDSAYVKRKISTTDIQALFSYYTQDGEHSAVTGGRGTEDLQVYSTSLALDHRKDSIRSFHMMAGLDIISSASTDNIDFEMSSASKTDFRAYLKAGTGRKLPGSGFTAGINGSFSFESDYWSLGPGAHISHSNSDQTREWTLAAQVYFDDLRWFDHGKHEELIYPAEMRHQKWFDAYRRTSYNLSFSLYQVINRRMSVGFYPGVAYQSGLLSTPFHRVYFIDETGRVENLPRSRFKVPVRIQLNTFIGSRWILRTYYRYYWDDFGITAHTLSAESPVKLSRIVTLIPFVRVYRQTAADHFKPYGLHEVDQEYYTSDYDLSQLESYKTGLGIRYAPHSGKGNTIFKEAEIRYAFYKRSDDLTANMISLFLNWEK